MLHSEKFKKQTNKILSYSCASAGISRTYLAVFIEKVNR